MKAIYEVQTFNDSADTENGIHTDDVARRFGFDGALVSGGVVYGHMTYLPMRDKGETWLTNNEVEVRFLKPAYDGDILTIELESTSAATEVRCINAAKTLLAAMASRPNSREPLPLAAIPPTLEEPTRQSIDWDNLRMNKPAAAHFWHAGAKTNRALADQLGDDLAVYRGDGALIHPFWILRECSAAFVRSFLLPAWIHVGSRIQFHKPLRVGDDVETRMIPIRKWQKHGHQFTTLCIALLVAGEVRVEAEHTAIFRIAPSKS